jgi:hypothetical protein
MTGTLLLTAMLAAGGVAQTPYSERPTSGYEILYEATRGMRPPTMPEDRTAMSMGTTCCTMESTSPSDSRPTR